MVMIAKKKIYKTNISPKTLIKLKKWWKLYLFFEDEFCRQVQKIEEKMAKDTGIEDIEFFRSDDGIVGIGNTSRTIKLIQREELEK